MSQQVESTHVETQQVELSQAQQSAISLWEIDKAAFSRSQATAREFGEALTRVKDGMLYGQYTNWLKENGIDRNRANYCTRLVKPKKDASGVDPLGAFESDPFLLAEITKQANKAGATIPSFVLTVLNSYVHQEVKLPEFSNYYGAWVNVQIEKLKSVRVLGGDVIHAVSWQERTEERVSRLLRCARPPRTLPENFVEMFESVYGPDKLPLLWTLTKSCAFAEHHRHYSKRSCETESTNEGYKTLSLADLNRPDYTEQEEQRRIDHLVAEQVEIETANGKLYEMKRSGTASFKYGSVFYHETYERPVYFPGERSPSAALARLPQPAEQLQRAAADAAKEHTYEPEDSK
jgi:hypothetical protein